MDVGASDVEVIDERSLPPDDLWVPPRQLVARQRDLGAPTSTAPPLSHRFETIASRLGLVGPAPLRFDPRDNSIVRRIVWEPQRATAARLAAAARLDVEQLTLHGAAVDWLRPGRRRAPGLLGVRRGRGRTPVWLTLEPWADSRCALTIEIRPGRRVGPSHRYFDAAHTVLETLGATVGAPLRPSASCQPATGTTGSMPRS